MKIENKKSLLKRDTKVILFVVIGLIIIIIGSSYALFFQVKKNESNQVVRAGSIKFTYVNGTEITSTSKANCFEPMSDERAESLNSCVYELSIQNNGSLSSNYTLNLTPNASNTLETSKMKVVLKKQEINNYNTVSGFPKLISSLSNGNLISESIAPNTTIVYQVQVYIPESLVSSSDNSKIISLNINGTGEVFENDLQAPTLYQGLIPIVYKDKKIYTADTSKKWYDYDKHEWANAILINYEDTTIRNKYFNGTTPRTNIEVDIDEVLQMYVWIPRYRYLLWNAENGVSEPRAIDIEFVNTNTKNPSGKQESEYKNGEWYVHPAFTFGETELPGIWVGKFEMSGTTSIPTILPNKQSLTGINVSTMFNTLQIMTNAKYGINTTTSDTHMMKNSEWGAVAYLTNSIYGRYNADKTCINSGCEVWINNINTGYGNLEGAQYTGQPQYGPSITGCAGASGGAVQNPNKTTCESGYDWLNNGVNASTTGNVTGIYDMSGGAWEYVMGVMYESNNTTPRYQSSGFNASTMPIAKYYNTYAYQESDFANYNVTGTDAENMLARYHLGEGTRETVRRIAVRTEACWYGDSTYFVYSSYPWVIRGGFYNDGSYAGLFYFYRIYGGAGTYYSFRSVLSGK